MLDIQRHAAGELVFTLATTDIDGAWIVLPAAIASRPGVDPKLVPASDVEASGFYKDAVHCYEHAYRAAAAATWILEAAEFGIAP